jgi:hypothetical protein
MYAIQSQTQGYFSYLSLDRETGGLSARFIAGPHGAHRYATKSAAILNLSDLIRRGLLSADATPVPVGGCPRLVSLVRFDDGAYFTGNYSADGAPIGGPASDLAVFYSQEAAFAAICGRPLRKGCDGSIGYDIALAESRNVRKAGARI